MSTQPVIQARTGLLVMTEQGPLRLPANITSLEAFRRWARSDQCPEKGHFGFLAGVFYVDLCREELYTHNQVKTELQGALHDLDRHADRGRLFVNGMLLTNTQADLATLPDAFFISYD